MRASDPRLILVAQQAAVRPPHVYHCFHSIAENPRAFSPDAFAVFSGLERRHVDRIMAALADNELLPRYRAREATEGRGTRLPAAFVLPDDWLDFAQREKRWHQSEVEAEFQLFIDYWHAQPGTKGVKLDWTATWRNWVRRSRTPSGTWTMPAEGVSALSWPEQCEQIARNWERMNRPDEAAKWRAKAV